jgi:hypothetical protein
MADDFDAAWLLLVPAYPVKDFVVGEDVVALHRWLTRRIPLLKQLVVVLG